MMSVVQPLGFFNLLADIGNVERDLWAVGG